jgi:hypothetical protein
LFGCLVGKGEVASGNCAAIVGRLHQVGNDDLSYQMTFNSLSLVFPETIALLNVSFTSLPASSCWTVSTEGLNVLWFHRQLGGQCGLDTLKQNPENLSQFK